MKRLKFIGIVMIILLAAGGTVLFLRRTNEPSYQGKTATEWIYKLSELRFGMVNPENASAIRALGTNALPMLIKMAGASDSKLKAKLIYLAERQTIIKIRLHGDWEKRECARLGFITLGEVAKPAAPELIKLTKHGDAGVRTVALQCLSCMHLDTNVVLPILAASLKDTDYQVSNEAAIWLNQDYHDEAIRLGAYQASPYLGPARSQPDTNSTAGK